MASASESDKRKHGQALNEGEERKEFKYRGVRRRSWGKWVSEIREPKKKSRIWLGSYDSPHKAARAYDAAALCLKGESAVLNFPQFAHTLPRPAQSLPQHIQQAASQAAQSFNASSQLPEEEIDRNKCSDSSNEKSQQRQREEEAMSEVDPWDEDLIFWAESQNMMVSMAEGLLLTPPRMEEIYDDDESLPVEPLYSLWNY